MMRTAIEKELNRFEKEIFVFLESEGIKPQEAVDTLTARLEDMAKTDSTARLLEAPFDHKGALGGLLVIWLARRIIEDEPDNTEIIGYLATLAETVGYVRGLTETIKYIREETGCDTLFSAFELAQSLAIKKQAARAAHVRHAENRETAERVRAWYAENHHRYRSMDKAAEAVIKIEPLAFKTARKHIGTAAKNLPPARKE